MRYAYLEGSAGATRGEKAHSARLPIARYGTMSHVLMQVEDSMKIGPVLEPAPVFFQRQKSIETFSI
jgi:hypothetical protein